MLRQKRCQGRSSKLNMIHTYTASPSYKDPDRRRLLLMPCTARTHDPLLHRLNAHGVRKTHTRVQEALHTGVGITTKDINERRGHSSQDPEGEARDSLWAEANNPTTAAIAGRAAERFKQAWIEKVVAT